MTQRIKRTKLVFFDTVRKRRLNRSSFPYSYGKLRVYWALTSDLTSAAMLRIVCLVWNANPQHPGAPVTRTLPSLPALVEAANFAASVDSTHATAWDSAARALSAPLSVWAEKGEALEGCESCILRTVGALMRHHAAGHGTEHEQREFSRCVREACGL